MFAVSRLICLCLGLALLGVASGVKAFETKASAAFVVDMTTGTILLEKNADTALPPASMSKLMTLYVAFEAVRDGRLSMDEKLPVSQHAMDYGGSTMFLDTTDRVTVEDLLRGIIVLSGNDACAVIAEALSPDGTEDGFARFMTQRAQQMGMTNSIFKNSNGWPEEGHVMSMRDLALLARRLIEDFPEFYPMFAETEFQFDGRAPQNTQNRNPLLRMGVGADGLKTGHTRQAGFGLVASAQQEGRRIILVVTGLPSAQARADETRSIVSWAFRQFVQKSVLDAGTEVARADVWMGREESVGLVAVDDVSALVPVLAQDELSARVEYTGPLKAPIAQGDQLAQLVLTPEGLPEIIVPLVANADVAEGGFMVRLKTVSSLLLARFTGNRAESAS